ncbi:MAG: hypothetical protein J6C26_05825 [Clostridia bacterium]|nr:hypothetical protein [Clostridia bacterium]
MAEHLYTIAINEHFGEKCGCPVCSLYRMLEKNEIETITGAAMMEPNVRIQTNKVGFCYDHFSMMLTYGKRLPVALILQSHLEEIRDRINPVKPDATEKYLNSLEHSCYVCDRIADKMASVYSNIVYLWKNDEKFRKLFAEQPRFCLPHYRALLAASKELGKKDRTAFCEALGNITVTSLETLSGDIDWFCKKFDYRFAKEDWKNSKDAIERTVEALTTKLPQRNGDDI